MVTIAVSSLFPMDDVPDQTAKNKHFWSYIKHQKSSSAGVAPLRKDSHLTSDPKAQVEVLNQQFQSVSGNGKQYTEEEFFQKPRMPHSNFPVMDDVQVTERGVAALL